MHQIRSETSDEFTSLFYCVRSRIAHYRVAVVLSKLFSRQVQSRYRGRHPPNFLGTASLEMRLFPTGIIANVLNKCAHGRPLRFSFYIMNILSKSIETETIFSRYICTWNPSRFRWFNCVLIEACRSSAGVGGQTNLPNTDCVTGLDTHKQSGSKVLVYRWRWWWYWFGGVQ